jgi:hypothetical protein
MGLRVDGWMADESSQKSLMVTLKTYDAVTFVMFLTNPDNFIA